MQRVNACEPCEEESVEKVQRESGVGHIQKDGFRKDMDISQATVFVATRPSEGAAAAVELHVPCGPCLRCQAPSTPGLPRTTTPSQVATRPSGHGHLGGSPLHPGGSSTRKRRVASQVEI